MAKRSWAEVDMAAAVASSSSVSAFLAVAFPTVSSLSSAPAAASATAKQAAAADAAAAAAATRVATLRTAAATRLTATRTKLDAARAALAELDAAAAAEAARRAASEAAAADAAAAEAELAALVAVRAVGDAHGRVVDALLGRGSGGGGTARSDPWGVAAAPVAHPPAGVAEVADLLAAVRTLAALPGPRRGGVAPAVARSARALAVGGVGKVRAALVNRVDTALGRLGWPVAPSPGGWAGVPAEEVDALQRLLTALERLQDTVLGAPPGAGGAARRGVPEAPAVPSWAAAALLRAPLARFKYHFLGAAAAGRPPPPAPTAGNGAGPPTGPGMDRVDRPEWAAEYALARLAEAGPLLSRLSMRFPYVPAEQSVAAVAGVPATIAAADAYARVYAAKVGDDVAAVAGEVGADALVLHAADAAAAFDSSLAAGLGDAGGWGSDGIIAGSGRQYPPLPSALAYLVADRPFFSAWTGAAVRVAMPRVLAALATAMAVSADAAVGGGGGSGGIDDGGGDEDDDSGELSAPEAAVAAVLRAVTAASATSRGMASVAGAAAFVRRVELPLLAAVRESLGDAGAAVEAASALGGGPEAARAGAGAVASACRSAYVATRLADAIVDRADSLFYIRLAEAAAAAVAAAPAKGGAGGHAAAVAAPGSAPGGIFEEDVLLLRATAASLTAAVGTFIASSLRDATAAYAVGLRTPPSASSPAAAAVAAAAKSAGGGGGGAVVLPPPSPALAAALGTTAHLLGAIPPAAVDRAVAAGAWRPAARVVGAWFPGVLLRAGTPFPGRGSWGRSAKAAAAGAGAPAAATALQAAADAAAVVSVWAAVTTRPGVAVRRVEEAGRVLRMGSKVAEEVLRTLVTHVADGGVPFGREEPPEVVQVLKDRLGVVCLSGREALELLAVAGVVPPPLA
ncbi:hypothetical protein MMPV_008558 [Pyropia vietnamensis]